MIKAAARPVQLGLAVGAALAIATGSLALATPAAPADGCAWQRHSKQIIKQVRRHGQLRRVKRLKHWWSCDALPAALVPAPALPDAPAQAAPPPEEPAPEASHLGVKAEEWSYTLSRPELTPGETIVELNNQGQDAHNLKLQREGGNEPLLTVPEAASKQQTSARFTLEPGTYRLYCSLYTHEEKGMHATLVVAPG